MRSSEKALPAGIRIAILCGGGGAERAVSLASGKAVARALADCGVAYRLVVLEGNELPEDLDAEREWVLPLVHGTYGEDGRLSAELEAGGFVFGGSAQAASSLCFDKWACKAAAARLQIPVAADRLLHPAYRPDFDDLVRHLGHPVILKPRFEGSSVGLFRVDTAAQYEAAGGALRQRIYLAESMVDGTDLTVGLLDGKALGVVAIYADGGLYDYEHKYTAGKSRYEAPAPIPTQLSGQLCRWAEILDGVCGCRDVARVDFRLTPEGQAVFLEINTIPGMTETSLLPKAASVAGMSFEDLVEAWVQRIAVRGAQGQAG